jgi:tetratricopeptide (TPR) repeat protein
MDVSEEAKSLHQQARQEGGKGNYENALSLLEQASRLAPQWPYPVYDMAFTLLLLRDFEGAREYYTKTLALSPRGFITAITALDTLDKEHRGELPSGTYLTPTDKQIRSQPPNARSTRRRRTIHAGGGTDLFPKSLTLSQ